LRRALCFNLARRRAVFRLRFGFFLTVGIAVVYVRRLQLSNRMRYMHLHHGRRALLRA
jgi:hypothetical protein